MLTVNQSMTDDQRMALASIRWLDKQADASCLALTQKEMAELLGGIPLRTLAGYIAKARNQQAINLTRDVRERLSLLLGISKALAITAPQGLEGEFFNRPNSGQLLAGKSIKQYLIDDGSMRALYSVRRWLDGQC